MENKVYLITGASSEVGRMLIQNLCTRHTDDGRHMKIYAHFSSHGEKLTKMQQNEQNAEIIPVKADLTKATECLKSAPGKVF